MRTVCSCFRGVGRESEEGLETLFKKVVVGERESTVDQRGHVKRHRSS